MNIAEPELAFLLEAFQLRDPELSERFDKAARPILRRMAVRHGYGLPSDVLDEVVQETFFSLSNPELQRFDASRSTASQYLLGRLLNAVKTVQLEYGLRRSGSDFENEPQREFVPIGELELTLPRGIPVEAIHASHTVGKIFAGVDDAIRVACMRVYGDEECLESVAADMNMSRFALARRFSRVKAAALKMMAVA